MSTLDQVRAIIADKPNYYRAVATGDGISTQHRLPHYPVIDGSAVVQVAAVVKTEGTDYTLDDALGILTLASAPTAGDSVIVTFTHTLLSDDDLETFLLLQADDVRLAAAMALDTIATNEALVQKRIKLLDLTTDGPAVAKSLREHAAQLREEADGDDDFDYAEIVTSPFGYDGRLLRQAQRGLL